jgi:hypothetical protein
MATSLVIGTASAQIPGDVLRSKIGSVRYAPLAEQARIQGDVHLDLKSGVVTVLSGPPLLAPIAAESAKSFALFQGGADIDVTYHFVLVETVKTVRAPVVVKRGDAVDRFLLRLFGFTTEKTVLVDRCEEGDPPPNDLKLSGADVEIWVYGRTHCLQTVMGTVVAQR